MARKVAGAVVLLLAILLSSSAGVSARIRCTAVQAKNPSCGTGLVMDGTCAKQCESEGYHGWICVSNCSCTMCPGELRKKVAGNKGVPIAGVPLADIRLTEPSRWCNATPAVVLVPLLSVV